MTTKKRKLKARVPSHAAPGSPPGCIATPKAKAIARHIFSKFDAGRDKCQRLAAKGGKYPDSETNLGGLCETAFAEMIERALREAQALRQKPMKPSESEPLGDAGALQEQRPKAFVREQRMARRLAWIALTWGLVGGFSLLDMLMPDFGWTTVSMDQLFALVGGVMLWMTRETPSEKLSHSYPP